MPKIRGIKPETWSDENFVELSPLARLLFIGLWNFACDNGHLEDRSKQIKLRILPADDCNVAELLRELVDNGRIVREDGWLTIPTLTEHQRIDKRWFHTCSKPGCEKPANPERETRRGHDETTASAPRDHGERTTGPRDDVDVDGDLRVMVNTSVQSVSEPRSLRVVENDGLDLDRIKRAIGSACTTSHATKTANFVLAKAPADVRNPTSYVLAAITDDPDAYRYRRGNPTKAQECHEHPGEWADACRACAIDKRLGGSA